jgi:hypothetical protein
MQSRKFRKSRKMRKSKKSRRGGAPAPINELIYFRTYEDAPDSFNPNVERPHSMREIFSSALIEHMRRDDPNYTLELNTQELGLPVIIQRIRGAVEEEIFRGEIPQWDDQKIRDFLVQLQPGDQVKLIIEP